MGRAWIAEDMQLPSACVKSLPKVPINKESSSLSNAPYWARWNPWWKLSGELRLETLLFLTCSSAQKQGSSWAPPASSAAAWPYWGFEPPKPSITLLNQARWHWSFKMKKTRKSSCRTETRPGWASKTSEDDLIVSAALALLAFGRHMLLLLPWWSS